LNEIMPMIYKRFTEKSAEEWRQIYKALQLMEFLVKNGSERVIDDARSHLSLLKMLRQFHYIDQNGKDQGLNVRNRSKELTDLLSDVEKIRAERKKARTTRNKYSGVEGGAGAGLGASSSRYGGFEGGSGGGGSTFGGQTRGVYGDGGGFGGETHDDYDEGGQTKGNDRFDEYDEFDDGGAQAAPGRRKADAAASRKPATASSSAAAKKPEPAKPKAPEVDLFEFGDDEPATFTSAPAAPSSFNIPAAPAAAQHDDDDDFDDFQSAAPASSAAPAPAALPKPNYSSFSTPAASTTSSGILSPPPVAPSGPNYSNFYAAPTPASSGFSTPVTAQQQQQPKSTGYQPTGPNYYTSVPAPAASSAATSSSTSAAFGGLSSGPSKPAARAGGAGGDAFANLLSGTKKSTTTGNKSLTIADMAKQKTQAGLYGAPAAAPNTAAPAKPSTGSSGLDDLLG
jgi:epsin